MNRHRISRFMAFAVLASLATVTSAARAAQLDTIELTAKDPTATAKWYTANFNGKRSGDRVAFGNVALAWKKAAANTPLPNPAIASIGFSVKNTRQTLDAMKKRRQGGEGRSHRRCNELGDGRRSGRYERRNF